ncbi:MAG: DUF6288 domain-containing protein [Kiritimatiellia bacterium]
MMKVAWRICVVVMALGVMAGLSVANAQGVHQLGPTGLTGTLSGKTLKIVSVAKGSPVDGLINTGDEIVGVGASAFVSDPRRELAAAIDVAETEAGGGKLTLMLKGGKSVDLPLTILGSYSDTAPWNCPKSQAIIERAAEAILASKDYGVATHTGLLGLMATGEQKYIDVVAEVIRDAKWAQPDQADIEAMFAGEKDIGMVGWYWGYNLIALGEYYLLTGDTSVLPAIRTYAVSLARGQDAGGLYGHRMATPARNGRLPGYAQMNQSSLTSLLGMLMAARCGIDDPILKQGIERTYAYYATFIGKGAFNYGVHGPNTRTYNNNGTSGSAAVCMALADNAVGTAFFSQLSATSFDGLEQGHASTFFNPLWTPLGANFSGPEVAQQFFAESRWLQTMYRRWDGSFSRSGGNERAGSQTGVALLTYCLPRKALFITGRDSDPKIWVKGDRATEVVQRSKVDYAAKSVDALLALLNHPIPQVRREVVWSLRQKEGDFIAKLVAVMESGQKREKLSAIEYFGWQCPPEQALPQLERIGAILRDKQADPEVRAAAAATLSHMGEPAYKYYNDMLQLIVDAQPGDRFRDVDQSVGASLNRLCPTPFATGLVTDKALLYTAAHLLMDHKRQHARESGVRLIAEVPLDDFHLVADKVMHIVEDRDDSYHSYHSWQGSIGGAIKILANLNIKEGIPYTVGVLDREDGKFGFKVRMICDVLPAYGANAKDALAELKVDPRFKTIENGRFRGMWQNMVKAIEEDPAPRKLMTFEEARQSGM